MLTWPSNSGVGGREWPGNEGDVAVAEGGHLLEERLDRAAIVDRHRDPTPARVIVEQNGGYPGRLGEAKASAHGGIAHGAREADVNRTSVGGADRRRWRTLS
ncbi:MAG TPA: hypothetical protein VD930_01840 [Gemmatimonadales bacterium]|nr:hypothetical protein [Gemmatimonadales bacterium]